VSTNSHRKHNSPASPPKPVKRLYFKTSYHIFCDKERNKVRAEFPAWKMSEVTRELGKRWNLLDEKKKRVFARQAAKEKQKQLEA